MKYTFIVTPEQAVIIGKGLDELKIGIALPTFIELQKQISEQDRAAKAPGVPTPPVVRRGRKPKSAPIINGAAQEERVT